MLWSFSVNRISPGLLLFAFFGVLMSLAVVYGLKRSWEQKKAVVVAPEPLRKIIVASADLPEGRAIHSSDFMTLSMTSKQFASQKWPAIMMADGKQLLTRILRQPIKRGQPFEPEAFYPEGSGPDVTQKLGPGLRAVSLDVATLGIPSQATPGNFVDVIFRSDPSKDKTIPELTRTLLTGVSILAIDDNSTIGLRSTLDRKRETHTVILAIPADEAIRLKATEGRGQLSLVLRNETDLSQQSDLEKSLSLADVLQLPPPEKPIPPPVIVEPPPILTEVFRRGQRQVTTFTPDGLTRINPGQRSAKPRVNDVSDPSTTQTVDPSDDPYRDDATAQDMSKTLNRSLDGVEEKGVDENSDGRADGQREENPQPRSDERVLPRQSHKDEQNSSPKTRSRQQINQTAFVDS
jgi:Flp pilus assembly protein CpaB